MAIKWFREWITGNPVKTMSIGEAILKVHEDEIKIDNQRKNINGLAKKYMAAKKRIVELEDQVEEYKKLAAAWKSSSINATQAWGLSEMARTGKFPGFDEIANQGWMLVPREMQTKKEEIQ